MRDQLVVMNRSRCQQIRDSLVSGTRPGLYEVLAPLGSGRVRADGTENQEPLNAAKPNRMSLEDGTQSIRVSETGELPSVSPQDARDG